MPPFRQGFRGQIADQAIRIVSSMLADGAVVFSKLASALFGTSPSSISTSNSEGTAETLARADHIHNHPSGLGANLHHNESHSHASHTGIGANDHHAQSHSHASHTGVGADDHHAQNHGDAQHTGTQPSDTDDTIVATSEGTTSHTYTDLTTVGPDVTVTAPTSGKVLILLHAEMTSSGAATARMSFAETGGAVAADDDRAIWNNGTNARAYSGAFLVEGLTPGNSYTFRAQYRSGNVAQTATFARRRITAIPL